MNVILLTTFNHPNGWEYLQALQAKGITLKGVVCTYNPQSENKVRHIIEKRVGDHLKLLEYSNMVKELSMPFHFTANINSQDTILILRKLKADIVVFAADVLLKSEVLNLKGIQFVNSHPALLPKYRGCNAMEWPILKDDPVGATCHVMDEGIDTGPIIYQRQMNVYPDDTYEALRARSLKHCAEVLADGVATLIKGSEPQEQKPEDGEYHERMNADQLKEVNEILNAKKYSHYTNQREASI